MEHKKGSRPTSSFEIHKFNSLTFLAWGKYEMPKLGRKGMIAWITQIVHNDILVKKPIHDFFKCKRDISSVKKRKTINWKITLGLLPQRTFI